jgi:predicted nucleic acid-binding protein
LDTIGLLGCLLLAKERGLLVAIKPVLDDLIAEAGFRVGNQLYREVLAQAGE